MREGLRWIGEHIFEEPLGGNSGMRGSISLTAARGVETEDFLVRLGADPEQLACGDLYRERHDLAFARGTARNWAMWHTEGGWLYVLEDWGMATWASGYRGVASMEPRTGEEIVCLTPNWWSPPQAILHAPGDYNRVFRAEFGEAVSWSPALDDALRAEGAVFPSPYTDPGVTAEQAARHREDHLFDLAPAVFAGTAAHFGLHLDRKAVEQGDLPLVILPSPA